MQTLAIEINDAGLVVADERDVLAIDPGYALVGHDGAITTGRAAYREARLKPRDVSNRFWSSLSVEPGSAGVGELSAAELAYAQLDALWREFRGGAQSVVLVVPGSYERDQLGLLLGLAEECQMPVRALVHTAVAASGRPYPGRQVLHVDAGLHRVAATRIEQGEEAVAGLEQALDATGLITANELLVRWIAETFVYTTRFDPFHHADTEQQLYDGLPGWLDALNTSDAAELTLEHGGETFAVTVERERLRGVLSGFNRAIVQLIAQARDASADLVVQLSDRLAELPGLARELGRLDDAEVVRLPTGQAARSALHGVLAMPLSGDAVRLLKHMPWRESAPADQAGDRGESAGGLSGHDAVGAAAGDTRDASGDALTAVVATHVIHQGFAYRVPVEGLVVGREPPEERRGIALDGAHGGVSREHCVLRFRDGELTLEDTSRYGTFVNERRIAGEVVLRPADIIRIGTPGVELQVIGLVNDNGA